MANPEAHQICRQAIEQFLDSDGLASLRAGVLIPSHKLLQHFALERFRHICSVISPNPNAGFSLTIVNGSFSDPQQSTSTPVNIVKGSSFITYPESLQDKLLSLFPPIDQELRDFYFPQIINPTYILGTIAKLLKIGVVWQGNDKTGLVKSRFIFSENTKALNLNFDGKVDPNVSINYPYDVFDPFNVITQAFVSPQKVWLITSRKPEDIATVEQSNFAQQIQATQHALQQSLN